MKIQINNIMRIINLKLSNEDSFKYSLLISFYYYDIPDNLDRITKLKKYEDRYVFTHNTSNEFEINNRDISLTIVYENNNIVYYLNNNTSIKGKIVKINDHRYAGIEPAKNELIRFNEFIKSYTHTELKNMFMQKINANIIQQS